MYTLISFIPLAVMIGVSAAYLKLSARLLRYTQVTWARCLGLGGIVVALTIVVRFVLPSSDGLGPILVGVVFSFVLHLALGSWLFRQRALDSVGQSLHWSGGAKLAALSFLMQALTGIFFAIVVNMLSLPLKA